MHLVCSQAGVYISKISYIRSGERSLDGYYKPYHTVVYYRYLRFFPDGEAAVPLLLCTKRSVVASLKSTCTYRPTSILSCSIGRVLRLRCVYLYLLLSTGVVMYQTSPEDPAGVVGKLCHKHSSEAVLLGEYCLDGHKASSIGSEIQYSGH